MREITAAERTIRRRIGRHGKITFAEFMQTALYHPEDGYYTGEKPFGAAGDFYTSPAVHPAFGALLAAQLLSMWRCMGSPPDFTVVELGAGNGFLAADICAYARELSDEFARRLRYICIERYSPSDANRDARGDAPNAQWLLADGLPLKDVVGCFISNEYVDAFAVNRFQVVGSEVLEVYVTLDERGEFIEIVGKPSTPLIEERLKGLGFALADGQCGEVNLHIRPLLNEMARALRKGFVITIDYGYEARELYSPERRFGTLQTYYRHTEGSSPYQRIGRQDISAHVDFSSLRRVGRSVGLDTLAYMTQAELLRSLGIGELLHRVRTTSMSQYERNANTMALRELVKPDGLGRFKALVQEKGTEVATYDELVVDKALLEGLRLPLISSRHMPLMQGRYPHTAWETPAMWGISDEVIGSSIPPS